MLQLAVTGIVRDEGTIVVFEAWVEGGNEPRLHLGQRVHVAVDHHMAQAIADALAAGDAPFVHAEEWQITRGGK